MTDETRFLDDHIEGHSKNGQPPSDEAPRSVSFWSWDLECPIRLEYFLSKSETMTDELNDITKLLEWEHAVLIRTIAQIEKWVDDVAHALKARRDREANPAHDWLQFYR